jgi:hypothetical protein
VPAEAEQVSCHLILDSYNCVYVAEWAKVHSLAFLHVKSWVQFPEADMLDSGFHPFEVGEMITNSYQWVTAVEDCEVNRRSGKSTSYTSVTVKYICLWGRRP